MQTRRVYVVLYLSLLCPQMPKLHRAPISMLLVIDLEMFTTVSLSIESSPPNAAYMLAEMGHNWFRQ